ncbi:hypothetical protein MIND_00591800 [Mycena indigotica]|uniref:Cytochrome P450 n=1 Tax=Mycena indigotica TaxID=2126181 RepID=A0A8H6STF3_9AGAR|nr:uncharacterized protein MIND_00591800 [Mycena indigotica]KAF7303625.1 hypothetical protein MIND_00591800 [Mycena indigotica]
MESDRLLPTILLALANHLYCNRHEPQAAHTALLVLLLQPPVLVLSLGRRSLVDFALVNLVFFATLALSITAYRLSPWHPLANIPGPYMAKITKLWAVKVGMSGYRHHVLKQLHERYGDCVRIGPNEISVINVDSVKSVLGPRGFQKGQFYNIFSDPNLGTTNLLGLRGDAHANRRRIWNRGMSTESMKGFEVILAKRVAFLLTRLDEFAKSGQKVDIAAWFTYLTSDFMGDMAFGGGFEMMRDAGDKDGVYAANKLGVKLSTIIAQVPWLWPTINLVPTVQRFRVFARQRTKARMAAGPKSHRDLWYHLMDEDGYEKVKPTLAEVVSDSALTIVAGSDTSSMALSSFVWCMISNPDIYARAQAEVDVAYPDLDSIITHSKKHGELKFLTACLQEVLRLFPPVPSAGPRRVPAGDPQLIAGRFFVPEHTQVCVPAWAIHRSEKNFYPSPEGFDPDRWLRPSTEAETLNQAAFMPFSLGAANCAAKNLAWRELLMTASAILKQYDMSFAEPEAEQWVHTIKDFYLTDADELNIKISLR